MAFFAATVFCVSLLAIVALFLLKRYEVNRERVIFPRMRVALDIKALELKNVLEHGREHFDRLQPILTDF